MIIVPHEDGVKFVKHIFNQEDEEPVKYFDQPPTDSEPAHHKFLLTYPLSPTLSWDPEIKIGNPSNLKIPCSIGHVFIERAYIDIHSPVNIMTRTCYNWVMKERLLPRFDPNSVNGCSNFAGRVKGVHVIVENFVFET